MAVPRAREMACSSRKSTPRLVTVYQCISTSCPRYINPYYQEHHLRRHLLKAIACITASETSIQTTSDLKIRDEHEISECIAVLESLNGTHLQSSNTSDGKQANWWLQKRIRRIDTDSDTESYEETDSVKAEVSKNTAGQDDLVPMIGGVEGVGARFVQL